MVLVLTDGFLYTSLIALGISIPSLVGKLLISCLIGILIARLFILGHDACHNSLFPSSSVNRFVCRLLFLPPFVAPSLWALGHNTIHHGYTNLKGRDRVWVPFSPEEWRALPRRRQYLERIYRHPLGLGFYYLIELWWNTLFFPSKRDVAVKRVDHVRDSLIVTAYIVALLAVVIAAQPGHAMANVGLLVILPYLVWCWLMGFVTFLHHTHPSVRWFDRKSEWSFLSGQVESVVQAGVPVWFNRVLHNIFDHTAHHVDTRIPCYQLPQAQQKAADIFAGHLVVEHWTWRQFRAVAAQCQIYDYRSHRWLRFDSYTTESEDLA
jgi:omega-6 fatty acid desaturase (delta-12 desaturase)